MAEEYVIANRSELVSIADAIREKTETTDSLLLNNFVSKIQSINLGCTVINGSVTLTEDISGQLTLFEVENSLSSIPDFLMLYYDQNDSSIVVNRPLAEMIFTYSLGNILCRGTYTICKTSGFNFYPQTNKNLSSSVNLSDAIQNNYLMFPYSNSVYNFLSGETYSYLAIYGKDVR